MKLNIPFLSGAGEKIDSAFWIAVGNLAGNIGLYKGNSSGLFLLSGSVCSVSPMVRGDHYTEVLKN